MGVTIEFVLPRWIRNDPCLATTESAALHLDSALGSVTPRRAAAKLAWCADTLTALDPYCDGDLEGHFEEGIIDFGPLTELPDHLVPRLLTTPGLELRVPQVHGDYARWAAISSAPAPPPPAGEPLPERAELAARTILEMRRSTDHPSLTNSVQIFHELQGALTTALEPLASDHPLMVELVAAAAADTTAGRAVAAATSDPAALHHLLELDSHTPGEFRFVETAIRSRACDRAVLEHAWQALDDPSMTGSKIAQRIAMHPDAPDAYKLAWLDHATSPAGLNADQMTRLIELVADDPTDHRVTVLTKAQDYASKEQALTFLPLPAEVITRMAHTKTARFREFLANARRGLPQDVWMELAADHDPLVREAVRDNPTAPDEAKVLATLMR